MSLSAGRSIVDQKNVSEKAWVGRAMGLVLPLSPCKVDKKLSVCPAAGALVVLRSLYVSALTYSVTPDREVFSFFSSLESRGLDKPASPPERAHLRDLVSQ